jgi:hypothetical protein
MILIFLLTAFNNTTVAAMNPPYLTEKHPQFTRTFLRFSYNTSSNLCFNLAGRCASVTRWEGVKHHGPIHSLLHRVRH